MTGLEPVVHRAVEGAVAAALRRGIPEEPDELRGLAWERCLGALPRLDPERDALGWLRRHAEGAILDHARQAAKRRSRVVLIDGGPQSESLPEPGPEEALQAVEAAAPPERLPPVRPRTRSLEVARLVRLGEVGWPGCWEDIAHVSADAAAGRRGEPVPELVRLARAGEIGYGGRPWGWAPRSERAAARRRRRR